MPCGCGLYGSELELRHMSSGNLIIDPGPVPSDGVTTAPPRVGPPFPGRVAPIGAGYKVLIWSKPDEAAAIWRDLETWGVSTPYQSLVWFSAWLSAVAPHRDETPLVVALFDDQSRPLLLLPLVVGSRFGARVASFPGGSHANFNMPLLGRNGGLAPTAVDHVFAAVARRRPDIDLVLLDALPPSWDGVSNPLVTARSRPHTAAASLVRLAPDPARPFGTALAPARLRKLRWVDRKIMSQGFVVRPVRSPGEVKRAIDTFLAHKVRWFRERGIVNPFGEAGAREFLVELCAGPGTPALIYALGRGDEITAVGIAVVGRRRASLMAISYDPDSAVVAYSPGSKIIREMASDLCRQGIEVFDFGLGEAAYKAALGAEPEPSFVEIRALTPRGRLTAILVDAGRRAKILAKQHPRSLAAVRAVQRWLP